MLKFLRFKVHMSTRFSYTSSFTKLILVIEFILVAYLLYSLTKNVYNSYQVDKYIETFEAENAAIADENKRKTEDYLYFTSEEYIDKIAKQNLGLVNPGEEIIILSPEVIGGENGDVGEESDFAVHSGMSNAGQWWELFFGD
ncbi:septum formation initiator family protein [Candidatus Peregrinibacteria bacterium]|nr:septum formation initiator family protein [Candidatus Peregrinibacteria bacterium]